MNPDFHQCSWEGQSMAPYSMTEPYECHEEATVHHKGADAWFCGHHYNVFDKKFGPQFPAPKPIKGTLISDLLDHVDAAERRVGA